MLGQIAQFQAPPYPASRYVEKETYDYRIQHGAPNPPTLVDALVCDLWQRIQMDLRLHPLPREVTEEQIARGVQVYLDKRWNNIAGYRPWTHWHFLRGLTGAQRAALAAEVAAYIRENGVRDPA